MHRPLDTAAALAALLLVAWTAPLAQEAPESDAHPAIGRLSSAGYRTVRHCTVTAVAPGVALTAAHCLRGLAAADLHVLFGYDRGRWDQHLGVLGLHPDTEGGDIAALCLDGEATRTLAVGPRLEPGTEVEIAGYGIPLQHVLSRTRCTIDAADERRMTLECSVTEGTSGAPVLRGEGADTRLIAVVSATGEGRTIAIVPREGLLAAPCGADAR